MVYTKARDYFGNAVNVLTQDFKHGVLFYHEYSGLKDIYQGLGDVASALTSMCKHLSIQLSENEGDIKHYCKEIKEQRYGYDVDVIFILGGDGTVNELINGMLQHDLDLPIGIIPGGTFNDFTKTLNLSGRHKTASQQLREAEIRPYDVIKVNETYALNFLGMGLIVQNAQNVQEGNKDLFGKLSYVGSTVKTLLNPEVFRYSLTVDGKMYEGETSMLIVANGPHIGGNRIPMTDMSPSDGQLNAFVFDKSKMSIMNDVFKQRDSMNWNKVTEGIKHYPGKSIEISTNQCLDVDIDGEIALTTPLKIEVIPHALRILTLHETDDTDA